MKKLAPFLVALAFAGPFCFAAVAETDAGWHVALGRLIGNGRFPHTNALSWKFGATPWYPTSWLYDVLVAARPGALWLQLVTFAFFAAALAALTAACTREGNAWVVPAIALFLVPRTVARPHVATWAILAAVLWLAPQSRRARLGCLALVALGSNLHAGAAFAAGVVALFAVEAFAKKREAAEILIAAGAGLALACNPGALFDFSYLVEHLLHVNTVVQLREFEPAGWSSEPGFFLLLPLALYCARRKPALLAACIVFAGLGWKAQRMTSEAAIVFAVAIAGGFALLTPRARVLATIGGLAFGVWSHRLDRVRIRMGPRFDEQRLPVRAAEFLARAHLGGGGFTGIRDGGYLESKGTPGFLDGRIQAVPPGEFGALAAAERSPALFDAYLRDRGCEFAVTTRLRERLGGFRLLGESPGWALVYWDDTNEVYVRRDAPRFSGLSEYRLFKPYGPIVGKVEQLSADELPALLSEVSRFEMNLPDDPLATLVKCAALTRQHEPDAARACAAADRLGAPPALVARARSLR